MSEDKKASSKKWQKLAEEASQIKRSKKHQPEVKEAGEIKEVSEEDQVVATVLEHPSYKALENKLTESESKAHENWDKATRTLAELDNMRRRCEREVENAHHYSLGKFAVELVPIIDSLEQALQMKDKTDQAFKNLYHGVELTLQLFLKVLKKFSIKQIDPVGEVFDPNKHEAMSMQTDPSVAPNTVISVFQKGYLLHERVIRPARVIVAKQPPESGAQDAP